MQSSKYHTLGVQIGVAGTVACLICALGTLDTDWLIMQLFFTCIYLNSYHCRKAAEVEQRLAELELSLAYKCRPIVAPPIPDFDKLPRF